MPARRFTLNQLIGIGLLTRLFIDTGVQVFFPFLRIIADGLGMSTQDLGRLLSLRSIMGLLSPLFGALAERRSNHFVMRLGLLLSGIGYLVIGSSQSLWMATLGMTLSAVGSFAYLPSLQAYLSARLPYQRRAWGLGIVEYAWALSGIVGLFLLGLLIAATSWRVPMYLIGGGLLIAWIAYRWLPHGDRDTPNDLPEARSPISTEAGPRKPSSFFSLGKGQHSAWINLLTHCFIMFAGFNLFIGYGDWLAVDYALGPQWLGTVALIIGVADLCASVLVSLISDRLGKRNSVIFGTFCTVLGFLCLPFFDNALLSAIVGLVLVRFSFEFSVVSNIPLMSEQVPAQRSKMLGLAVAFGLSGSAVAGLTGPWLLAHYDILGVSAVSAMAMLISFMLVWLVKEPQAQSPAA